MESVLLASIQRDLFTDAGFTLFKQEVARLMADRRRQQGPNREHAKRELAEVEREIANIIAAIKAGIVTPSTKAALEQAEATRACLQAIPPANPVDRMLPNLKARFGALVGDLTTLHHVDQARAVLKRIFGGPVMLHPSADGAVRYLTAEVSGDFAELLRLTLENNNDGGGQGN